MSRLLVLFFDGVGIGSSDPDINPFFRARPHTLLEVLGGALPSSDRPTIEGVGGRAFPIDATLGVQGLPQSGTGQVSLLTGRNAPTLLGRHFGPWPPVRFRSILEDESFLKRTVEAGPRVAFANAYPEGLPNGRSLRRVPAPVLAARGAGLLDRHHDALARGEAVASDIVNDAWRAVLGYGDVPLVAPEDAGRNLAAIAAGADLTFFAHYSTDFVGHRGGMAEAESAVERVDRFLAGLLEDAPRDLGILLVSDHGNLEDVRTGHTRNPALGMALGPRGSSVPPPSRLTEVPGVVLSFFGIGVDERC